MKALPSKDLGEAEPLDYGFPARRLGTSQKAELDLMWMENFFVDAGDVVNWFLASGWEPMIEGSAFLHIYLLAEPLDYAFPAWRLGTSQSPEAGN